jgi:hypothetical protein
LQPRKKKLLLPNFCKKLKLGLALRFGFPLLLDSEGRGEGLDRFGLKRAPPQGTEFSPESRRKLLLSFAENREQRSLKSDSKMVCYFSFSAALQAWEWNRALNPVAQVAHDGVDREGCLGNGPCVSFRKPARFAFRELSAVVAGPLHTTSTSHREFGLQFVLGELVEAAELAHDHAPCTRRARLV